MKHIFILIIFSFTFSFGQNVPFKVGEHLTYTLRFNVIKMGQGSLTVEAADTVAGIETYHVKFGAKTGRFADHFFRVRDNIDIWLNKNDLTTLKINKKIREGGYHRDYNSTINYDKSIAITNQDTVRITGPVRDPYSLLYYFRTIPLEVGQILDLTTFDRNKSTEFQVVVEGKEIVKTAIGNFPCIVVRPFRAGNELIKNEGDMKIWFSDNEQRIPIKIEIKIKHGSMLLQIKEINL